MKNGFIAILISSSFLRGNNGRRKIVRYDVVCGQYWKILENIEKTIGDEKSIFIGKTVAVFYDNEIKKTIYHGHPDEVKAKIEELTEYQKKAEEDLGFFLNNYKYYEFNNIDISVLNKIILQEGWILDGLV